jgi:hypothetical protein
VPLAVFAIGDDGAAGIVVLCVCPTVKT